MQKTEQNKQTNNNNKKQMTLEQPGITEDHQEGLRKSEALSGWPTISEDTHVNRWTCDSHSWQMWHILHIQETYNSTMPLSGSPEQSQ